MAIKNGNTNFNLSVSQVYNEKKIRVSFRYQASQVNPVRIQLQAPYTTQYGPRDQSVQFTNSDGTTTITHEFEVVAFGGYKIHISTNQGHSYDFDYVDVRVIGAVWTNLHTFTTMDVANYNAGALVVTLTSAIAGLIPKVDWPAGIATIMLSIASFLTPNHQTDWENAFYPIVGWSMRIRVSQPNLRTVRFELNNYDQHGRLNKTLVSEFPVLRMQDLA